MTSLYELTGVRQLRGAKLVLDLPALSIRAGAVHTLVGPNGSGKTTLLALLAFLAPPAAGEVRFDGAPVEWSRAALLRLRRQVTLVHQSPYLFDGTVEHNLAIGLAPRGLGREEARARVEEALRAVSLGGFGPRHARALSQGEAQRVAVARALLLEPRVLLLDEPLANLDRKSAAVIEELVAASPSAGRTVVMASHDPTHPARLGAEVIALQDGALASPQARAPAGAGPDRAAPRGDGDGAPWSGDERRAAGALLTLGRGAGTAG